MRKPAMNAGTYAILMRTYRSGAKMCAPKYFDVFGDDGQRKLRIVAVDMIQAINIVARLNLRDYTIKEAKR